jgi:hypothetical protein
LENKELSKIFGPERKKVRGEWRKLHNEELNDLYSSPNIIQVIKSSRMRGAGHIACMGKRWGNMRDREHLEDQGIDWRII